MGERQRHDDAVGVHAAPALGQVPEHQQQPVVDALVVGDRERDGEMVRAPGAAVEQLDAELRPRAPSAGRARCRGPRAAAGSSTTQPTSARTCEPSSSHCHGRITSPWPSSSTQRRPSTSTVRLSSPSTIMKPRWWVSTLERRAGVPLAGREPQHAGERLAPRALQLIGREQVAQVGIGVDDAQLSGATAMGVPAGIASACGRRCRRRARLPRAARPVAATLARRTTVETDADPLGAASPASSSAASSTSHNAPLRRGHARRPRSTPPRARFVVDLVRRRLPRLDRDRRAAARPCAARRGEDRDARARLPARPDPARVRADRGVRPVRAASRSRAAAAAALVPRRLTAYRAADGRPPPARLRSRARRRDRASCSPRRIPAIDLRAITTVAGNGRDRPGHAQRAAASRTLAGLDDVPIAAGAAGPRARRWRSRPTCTARARSTAPRCPSRTSPLDPRPARELIAGAAREPLTLVATGPLTNVAEALDDRRPGARARDRVDGRLDRARQPRARTPSSTPGRTRRRPRRCSRAAIPFTMVGLNLTHQALATAEVIARLGRARDAARRRPSPAWLDVLRLDVPRRCSASPRRRSTTRARSRSSRSRPWCAASPRSWRSRPRGAGRAARPSSTSTAGSGSAPNARVAVELDVARFWDLVVDAVARLGR